MPDRAIGTIIPKTGELRNMSIYMIPFSTLNIDEALLGWSILFAVSMLLIGILRKQPYPPPRMVLSTS